MPEKYTKPPLGIMPRNIVDQSRLSDIFQAILRYMTEGATIPRDWVFELNDILDRYTDGKGDAR